MLSFFRRLSKSKLGTGIVALLFLLVLIGFAATGVTNFGSGDIGLGSMSSSTLARVGDQEVSERDMSEAMQRRLQDVRAQNPEASYASIASDFDALLAELIDQKTMVAFADKFGLHLSKPLIDAEIIQLPQAKGLNGKFNEQAYQQFLARQRFTDAQVREIIASRMLEKLVLAPVATNARIPVGMATPYASMMLEARQGDAVAIPVEPFKAGLKPTDADVQQFYAANRAHYMIPEQRVLRIARIGPEQVANVTASDQEIAAYYNANQAIYAAKETRNISQVVVPDQNTANAIAAKAKAGATLAAAAAPAGTNAAVTSVTGQTRQAYAGAAGENIAAAVFSAASGVVVGPLHSDFGWVVVKVDAVKKEGGKSLAQARPEIVAKLNADKRKGAIEDLEANVEDAIGKGSNFTEAAAAAKLPVTTTPLITGSGTSRTDASYRLPPELAPALKSGFELAPNDPPDTPSLGGDQGYAMVSPAQVVPAAPAPLASIRDQVAADWLNDQARRRAAAAATSIADKAARGQPLAQAVKESGIALPPVQSIGARRIQIASQNGQVPPPLKLLFSMGQGKSRMIPDPGGRGFYVVKTNTITPGNAFSAPGLISRMQSELQEGVQDEYARQFMAAIRAELKVRRNESAIAAEKTTITTSGS